LNAGCFNPGRLFGGGVGMMIGGGRSCACAAPASTARAEVAMSILLMGEP
jgi:hypothetical protein